MKIMESKEDVLKALCHCGRSVAEIRNPLSIFDFQSGWRVKPAMTDFRGNSIELTKQ